MNAEQIINKIKQGKFTKQELSKIIHAVATAISEENHDKD